MSLEEIADLELEFLSNRQMILIEPPIRKVMAIVNPLGHRCTDGGKSFLGEVFRQILAGEGISANKYFTGQRDHGHTVH
jgi:hypothetical protein